MVWKLDRLGRSLSHLSWIVEELKERGVPLAHGGDRHHNAWDVPVQPVRLAGGVTSAPLPGNACRRAWLPHAGAGARGADRPRSARRSWSRSRRRWRAAPARPACAAPSRCRGLRSWTPWRGQGGQGRAVLARALLPARRGPAEACPADGRLQTETCEFSSEDSPTRGLRQTGTSFLGSLACYCLKALLRNGERGLA